MSYKLVYTDSFLNDILDIVNYIALDNIDEALKLRNRIEKDVLNLQDFPFIGAERTKRKIKFRFILVGNYIVYYTVNETKQEVYLKRILHGAKYQFTLD